MVDIARIEELRDEIGEEDMCAVFEIFRAEAEDVILTLCETLDDDAYEKAIHFLRSGAVNLGLQSLADHAESLRNTPERHRSAAGQDLKRSLAQSFSELTMLDIAS